MLSVLFGLATLACVWLTFHYLLSMGQSTPMDGRPREPISVKPLGARAASFFVLALSFFFAAVACESSTYRPQAATLAAFFAVVALALTFYRRSAAAWCIGCLTLCFLFANLGIFAAFLKSPWRWDACLVSWWWLLSASHASELPLVIGSIFSFTASGFFLALFLAASRVHRGIFAADQTQAIEEARKAARASLSTERQMLQEGLDKLGKDREQLKADREEVRAARRTVAEDYKAYMNLAAEHQRKAGEWRERSASFEQRSDRVSATNAGLKAQIARLRISKLALDRVCETWPELRPDVAAFKREIADELRAQPHPPKRIAERPETPADPAPFPPPPKVE